MAEIPTNTDPAKKLPAAEVAVLAYPTPTPANKVRGATLPARCGAGGDVLMLLVAAGSVYSESRHLRDGVSGYIPALFVIVSGIVFFVLVAFGWLGTHSPRGQ